MRVAIMQPAFIPPASYFRLFAIADVFVVLDDVQLNRRWYTNRQQLPDATGKPKWLTLPLKGGQRDTTMIKDMQWMVGDAEQEWLRRLRKFPLCGKDRMMGGASVRYDFMNVTGEFADTPPLQFICTTLEKICAMLEIPVNIQYASAIGNPLRLRKQERMIDICQRVGGKYYVNSPGGRDLYDKFAFARGGLRLEFLSDWKGNYKSIIERLADETPNKMRKEIMGNL